MDHKTAIIGNGAAWIGTALSFITQLTVVLQAIAAMAAVAAGIYTALYYRQERKQRKGKGD